MMSMLLTLLFTCLGVFGLGEFGLSDFSSERAPHRDNTATFRQNITSGHKFQSELDTTTY
jgi:hypothetical protein